MTAISTASTNKPMNEPYRPAIGLGLASATEGSATEHQYDDCDLSHHLLVELELDGNFVVYFCLHTDSFAGKDGRTSTRFWGKTRAQEFP
jgi:hypothetical protein